MVCGGDDALNQKGGLVESYLEKGKLEGLIDTTVNRECTWKNGWVGKNYTEEVKLVPPIKWEDQQLRKRGYGAALIDDDRFIPGDCVTVM